ncbi:MAG: AMP-binding protein [Sphingobacteriales bacterium]|jgi:acyl-CoA synthetase (AMP-forming)/AMP-acid ligase II|nr:AMP-binding protein [Sphingobacteriales bacterium]MBP9140739.1 AMP-binding protein [Chitinophagales bacterium]MDA0197987.1 AMP-binding protein [Bacteroidota bacterium]MBK6890509.1 AMP-binding protein [Sphingobacteriales bacterium]MBK7526440.1 AMP-binding protein [Sphingobacteriales bacterium]
MINENITSLFYKACKNFPERHAVIQEKRAVTFSQLELEVARTIAYFEKKGIKKGDRVLVFVGMSIDLYRIVLALFSMGAVAVFVDEWVNTERLSLCCKIAKCKAIIAPLPYRIIGLFIAEIRKIPIFLNHKKQTETSIKTSTEPTAASDSALITFTTGSTGTPKAADRSHGFLKAQFDALTPLIKGKASMTMLPVVLLLNLGLGITSVIADFKTAKPKKFKAQKILTQIKKYEVDSLIASPYYLLELAKATQEKTSLKHIISGGAAIFASDAKIISASFSNANFTVVYGSTEAEPISHCQANELIECKNDFGLLAGKPVSSVALKIMPPQKLPHTTEKVLNNLELPQGNIGEIIVSGNAVNKTYIDNPEAVAENKIITEKIIWHRTGDSGYLNEQGNLFLTGRTAQIIEHNKKVYYPFVIENKLKNIEGVKLGTLILWNNKLILALCTTDSFSENLLSGIEYDEIRYFKSLPLDPRHYSKIDYQKLTQLL